MNRCGVGVTHAGGQLAYAGGGTMYIGHLRRLPGSSQARHTDPLLGMESREPGRRLEPEHIDDQYLDRYPVAGGRLGGIRTVRVRSHDPCEEKHPDAQAPDAGAFHHEFTVGWE